MVPIIVITRFNLAIKYRFPKLYRNVPKGHYVWLDNDYLQRRFDLFERYTFPSFLNQTDQDFRWIVLFHKETPQKFKVKIQEFGELLHQFEPVFLDDNDSEHFVDIVNNKLEQYKGSDYITIRIDNDDAIHSTFIENIRSTLDRCQETSVLCFRNGLQFEDQSGRCMRYSYINNHFLALFVSGKSEGKIKNVLEFSHPNVDSVVDSKHKLVRKTRVPLWVEIISECNCTNVIWNRPSKVFVPFSIKTEYPVLPIKWESLGQWIWSILSYIPISFAKMIVDVVRLITIKIKMYGKK